MIKIKCSAQVSAQKYFKGLCVATLPAFAPLFLSLLFLHKNKSLINIRLLRGEKVCLIIIELI